MDDNKRKYKKERISLYFFSYTFSTDVRHHYTFKEIKRYCEDREGLISAREKLAVCDVTSLPYMDINW